MCEPCTDGALVEAANRAKSLFLANMSHELRTPLNTIIGFSHIIRDQAFGPDAARYSDYAKHIASAGEQLLTIIESVLDFANLQAGKSALAEEWIGLDDVLRKAVAAGSRSSGAQAPGTLKGDAA
jgi:signal transduction histidine kinase